MKSIKVKVTSAVVAAIALFAMFPGTVIAQTTLITSNTDLYYYYNGLSSNKNFVMNSTGTWAKYDATISASNLTVSLDAQGNTINSAAGNNYLLYVSGSNNTFSFSNMLLKKAFTGGYVDRFIQFAGNGNTAIVNSSTITIGNENTGNSQGLILDIEYKLNNKGIFNNSDIVINDNALWNGGRVNLFRLVGDNLRITFNNSQIRTASNSGMTSIVDDIDSAYFSIWGTTILDMDGMVLGNTQRLGGNSVSGAIFSIQGGAGYTPALTVNGNVSFVNNIGAGNSSGVLALNLAGPVTFTGSTLFKNNSTGGGGSSLLITAAGVLTFGGKSTFLNNTSGNLGGAIALNGANSSLTANDDMEFIGNLIFNSTSVYGVRTGGSVNSNAGGGAIYLSKQANVNFNGSVLFDNNWVNQPNTSYSAYGGAINLSSQGASTYTMSFNQGGIFRNNYVYAATGSRGMGGAIYANGNTTAVLNLSSGTSGLLFDGNAASGLGGAIYLSSGIVNISATGANVTFQNNLQNATFTVSGSTVSNPTGGSSNAIYLANTGSINLLATGTNRILFYDPITSATGATVTITKTGNGEVVFSSSSSPNNLGRTTTDVQAGLFHLLNGVTYGSNGAGITTVRTSGTLAGAQGAFLKSGTINVNAGGSVFVDNGLFTIQSSTFSLGTGGALGGSGTLAVTNTTGAGVNITTTGSFYINAMGSGAIIGSNPAPVTGTLWLSPTLAGTGKMVKQGDGTYVIDTGNSYTGGSEIQAGTVLVRSGTDSSFALGTGAPLIIQQGGTLSIARSGISTYALSASTSGAGFIDVDLGNSSAKFSNTTMQAFLGTMRMRNASYSTTAGTNLQGTTYVSSTNSITTIDSGTSTMRNFIFDGGAVVVNSITGGVNNNALNFVQLSGTLDLTKGGNIRTNDANLEKNTNDMSSYTPLLLQDDYGALQALMRAPTVIGDVSTLTFTKMDGLTPVGTYSATSSYANIPGGTIVAQAHYNVDANSLSTGYNNDGLYLSYVLTQLDLLADQSTVFTNGTTASYAGGSDFKAKITGSGNLIIAAVGAITLMNSTNSYSGTTQVTSGTLLMGDNQVLGYTSNVIVNQATDIDTAGKSQTGAFSSSINGTLNVRAGSTWDQVAGPANTGAAPIGQITMGNGAAGAGAITIANGATVRTDNVSFVGASGQTSAININGGVLDLHGTGTAFTGTVMNQTAGTSGTVVFNGGTMLISGTSAGNAYTIANMGQRLLINAGGATINTGANQLTLDANSGFSGAGTLHKQGAGNLTLNGAGSYAGGTEIEAGSINMGNTTALGTGTANLFTSTTLSVNTGAISFANTLKSNAAGAGDFNVNLSGSTAVFAFSSSNKTQNYSGKASIMNGTYTLRNGDFTNATLNASAVAGATALAGRGTIIVNTGSNHVANYGINGGITRFDLTGMGAYANGWIDTGAVNISAPTTISGTTYYSQIQIDPSQLGMASGVSLLVADDAGARRQLVQATTITGTVTDIQLTDLSGNVIIGANTSTQNVTQTSGVVGNNGVVAIATLGGPTLAQSATGIYAQGGAITKLDLQAGKTTVLDGDNGTPDGSDFKGTLIGTGNLWVNATQAITLKSGSNTYTGTTTVNTGTLVGGAANIIATSTGLNIANGAAFDTGAFAQTVNNLSGGSTSKLIVSNALTENASNDTTFAGAIVGGAGSAFTKTGAGALTLTGNSSTYAATMNVNAGTLRIGTGALFGNNNSTTTIANGAQLIGTGTIGGAVNLLSGATLAAGELSGVNGVGTLTLGGLTLNAGSISNFNLGQANTAGGALNDYVSILGNLAVNGGSLDISTSYNGVFNEGTYTLFSYGGLFSGNVANLSVNLLPDGVSAADISIIQNGNLVQLVYSAGPEAYWDGAGMTGNSIVDGGNGTWTNNTTNWTKVTGSTNSIWANGKTAVFAGIASGTATVTGTGIQVSGLRFERDGYLITGGSIALSGSNGETVINTQTSDTMPTVSATIATTLTGTTSLVKTGQGALTLTGSNTYTGTTNVTAGQLTITNANAISARTLNIESGAIFAANIAGNYTLNNTLTGAGLFRVDLGATSNSFNLTPNASATFTGTARLANSAYTLQNQDFTNATLVTAGGNQLTIVSGSNHTAGFGFDGGTVDFSVSSGTTADGWIKTGTLTITAAGGTIAVTAPASGVDLSGKPLLQQDEGTSVKLIGADALDITGSLTLLGGGTTTTADIKNASLVTTATATYGQTLATQLASGEKGLFLNYELTQLDLIAGQTTTLENDSAPTPAGAAELHAKVTGAGSLLVNATGTITLNGANTYTGTTTVQNGTLVSGVDSALGNTARLNIATGANFDLNGKNQTLGYVTSASNTKLLINGGTLTGIAATNWNINGLLDATAANSVVNTPGALIIGSQGTTAQMLIASNAVVTSNTAIIGDTAGSAGGVTISGSGAWVNNSTFYIGNFGSGTLTITNSGSLKSTGNTFIANGSTGQGTLTVRDNAYYKTNDIIVGQNGNGTLLISDNAKVSGSRGFIGMVGANAKGTVTVSGNGYWENTGALTIGQSTSGTLTITNSGSVSNTAASIGSLTGGQGSVSVNTNGVWINSGELLIGDIGTGVLNISDNALVRAQNVGFGSDTVGTGNGTLNLNGGALEATGLTQGAGAGMVNFNGGILRALNDNASFITNFNANSLNIQAGGAYIDSNGHVIEVAANNGFSGVGALHKIGSGTLTLNSAGSYAGGTEIRTGALIMTHIAALGTGTAAIAQNAELRVNTGDNAFANTLAGAGLFQVDLNAATNTFRFQPSALGTSTLFTGTALFRRSTYTLDNDALASALLQLAAGNTTTVATGSHNVGNLTYDGGSTGFSISSGTTADGWIKTGTLTITAAGGTIAVTAPASGVDLSGKPLLQQDEGTSVKLIGADALDITGSLTLLGGGTTTTADIKNASLVTTATATYGQTLATQLASGEKGLFLNYELTQLDLIAGQTTTLENDSAPTPAGAAELHAKVTGAGNLLVNATGTITLNGANTYTGTTTVQHGTLVSGVDSALGNTAQLRVLTGAAADMKNHVQNITQTDASAATPLVWVTSGTVYYGSGTLTTAAANTSAILAENNALFTSTNLVVNGTGTNTAAITANNGATVTLTGGAIKVTGDLIDFNGSSASAVNTVTLQSVNATNGAKLVSTTGSGTSALNIKTSVLTGNVITSGNGTTNVALTASTLTGAATRGAGSTLNFNIGANSTWVVTADSTLSRLTNNGTVDFLTTKNAFKTLTMDNLDGNGTFKMNVSVDNYIVNGDKIVVNNIAQGTHQIVIKPQVGNDLVTGNFSFLLVQAGNSTAATLNSAGTPVKQPLVGSAGYGMRTATVQRGTGVNSSNWYLVLADSTPPPAPPPPAPPLRSSYASLQRSQTADVQNDMSLFAEPPPMPVSPGQVVLGSSAARTFAWFDQDSLVRRMGELHMQSGLETAEIAPDAQQHAVNGWEAWTRASTSRTNADATVTGQTTFRQNVSNIDVGADKRLDSGAKSRTHLGVFGTYGYSDIDYNYNYSGGNINAYAAGAYLTWVHRSGAYADLTAKGMYFDNTYTGRDASGNTTKGDNGSWAAGARLEIGWQLEIEKGWFVQPNATASYAHFFGHDYSTTGDNRFGVAQQDGDVLQTTFGAIAGCTLRFRDARTGALTGGYLQPYVKGSIMNQTGGGNRITTFDGTWNASTNGGGDILGAGLIWQINRTNQLYLNYEATFAEKYKQPYNVSLGYRRQF